MLKFIYIKLKDGGIMKSKKQLILTVILLAIVLTLFSGCGNDTSAEPHEHKWSDATCTDPKICEVCGETEGNAVGHDFTEADCDSPKTCRICNETEGEAIGHDWQADEKTGIVICVRDDCNKVKDSEIPQDKNLVLGLSKIPIATGEMTTDELRDIVVQFMKLQINFAYRANISYNEGTYGYYIKNLYSLYDGDENLENLEIKFEDGKYYGGIPYMGNAAGGIYRWLPFYDAQTGDMDWSPIITSRRENWEDTDKNIVYPDVGSVIFGNSCSAACFWAWSRVTNEINTYWTNGWVPSRGFVKIGDYVIYSEDDPKLTCRSNGEKIMYESYAQMLRADGLVDPGHAVMVIEDPVVVYNDNGTINGYKSYVVVAEQKASFLTESPGDGGVDLYSPMNDDGVNYRVMGNCGGNTVNGELYEMKWSFRELYDEGYLPFTVPELAGTGVVEKSTVEMKYTESSVTIAELENQKITSNYPISDVNFEVRDKDGELVFTACFANHLTSPKKMKSRTLVDALIANDIYEDPAYIKNNLTKYTDGSYTVEILCRLANGELVSAYSGTLIE